jgi:hypothetical protein
MPWDAITAIATVVSMVAYIVTALYIRAELKALEKDRYLAVTGELFAIWESKDFMEAQLWLLHRLEEKTWPDFIRAHRAGVGEAAFHRVGAFYDRVGTLVRRGLVNKEEILATVGAHAIAVWQKIQGLVYEARRIEQSTLFADFERLLPSCHQCYVPALGPGGQVNPFALTQPGRPEPAPARVSLQALWRRLDGGEAVTVVDVRHPGSMAQDPRTLPGAVWLPIDDLPRRLNELHRDRDVIVYCA